MATTDRPEVTGGAEEWRERYEATREREGELFSTISGVENEPLYSPENVELDYERDLGWPGAYPFTRGVYPSMYRGRLWTMRQFAGFGTAEETNARFRYLLEHGQTGLSTAFDMPTLMGYDSDHPRSLGEVGREGVAVDSLDDMKTLFSGIPLGDVSTSMTINSPAAMLLAFYVCVGEEQGVPRERLRGTIQTDILKEYIAQKEYIFPPEPSMRLVTDMVEFTSREMPLWHPISISGYHIREAGSTAAQELAFTLADGFTYVEWAVQRGLDVDEFAPRLSFFFNAHLDFFEEIANETGVVNTIDPLGGSYYVEYLTSELERQAYEYFDQIEKLGGVVEAIKENFFQREIAEASFRYQSEVEAKQRIVVGVNKYELQDEVPIEILKVNATLEQKQIDRVQALKARRDSGAVEAALGRLKEDAARDDRNLIGPIVDASRAN